MSFPMFMAPVSAHAAGATVPRVRKEEAISLIFAVSGDAKLTRYGCLHAAYMEPGTTYQ
jgi:hypothetical protein